MTGHPRYAADGIDLVPLARACTATPAGSGWAEDAAAFAERFAVLFAARGFRPGDRVRVPDGVFPRRSVPSRPFAVVARALRSGNLEVRAPGPGRVLRRVAAGDVDVDGRAAIVSRVLAFAGDPGPLVVVPCGAQKQDRAVPAGQLYTGGYHRLTMAAASALGPRRVLILSGRHGLVDPGDWLEPYDQRLADIDTDRLVDQALLAGEADAPDVVALTPRAYTDALRAVWADLAAPFEGSRGLFEQRRIAAGIRDTGRLPVPLAS